MRTSCLEAWKKELEFWSKRENGRQDLNVLFESIESINEAQLEVMLLLNPVSKGVGRAATELVVAATMPLVDVVVGASVVDAEEEDLELMLRRRRSRSSVVSNAQFLGSGGGR